MLHDFYNPLNILWEVSIATKLSFFAFQSSVQVTFAEALFKELEQNLAKTILSKQ